MEGIQITYENLGTVNKNCITIGRKGRYVNLWFSYNTLVAVDRVVSENDWGRTTGKLLNQLEANKTARVPHEAVLKEAQNRIKRVLYDDEELCVEAL